MEEKQVTIDGVTRKLEAPFFVIATQNPVETTGTFPLPEAQLDRFLMQLSMGLPSKDEELAILQRFQKQEPLTELTSVCQKEAILKAQQEYRNVTVHPSLMNYIVELVSRTRTHAYVVTGVSPRGSLAFLHAVQAYAYLHGRSYAVPEDIKTVAVPVLAHRLITNRGVGNLSTGEEIIRQLLAEVPVPTETWN